MLKKITIAAMTLFAASFMMNTAFAASKNDANTNANSAMQASPVAAKTSAQVLAWANQAVAAAYASKSHHAASSYFTRSAWQDFHKSMKVTGQAHNASSKKLAITTGTPVIIAKGTFNNMPAWQVQVPLVVAHQNHKDTMMANMVVVQCPKKKAIDGLVATQFNVTNPKS